MIEGFDITELLGSVFAALFVGWLGVRGWRRRREKRSSVDAVSAQPPSEPTPMEREHAKTDEAIRESDARATAPANGPPVVGSDPATVADGRDWLADDEPNG